MTEILVITVLIIAISLALLCIKLFVRKDGEFTSMHIHDSQAMKDRGIHCVMDQDREMRRNGKEIRSANMARAIRGLVPAQVQPDCFTLQQTASEIVL